MTSNSFGVNTTAAPRTRTSRVHPSIARSSKSARNPPDTGASAILPRRRIVRTRAATSLGENGFTTQSSAPSSRPAIRSTSLDRAVSTIRSGVFESNHSMASAPLLASATMTPSSSR